MEIGIYGLGVVGGTLKRWLEKNNPSLVIRCNDPALGLQDDMTHVKAIFICIPVPTLPDRSQDLSGIVKILEQNKYTPTPIFIKSTVLPGTCDRLGQEHRLSVYAMPEFLTERTADEDFAEQDVICGGVTEIKPEFLLSIFPGKGYGLMWNRTAEIAKYAHNAFAALKVGYFNMIHELCEQMNGDYESVLFAIATSGLIEPTHTQVPGPDGKYGFGGKCLPKDLAAFLRLLTERNIPGVGMLENVYRWNANYYRNKGINDAA
jgi:UDP-glucose 6-dehydrogenase